jgi:hypothetical protein
MPIFASKEFKGIGFEYDPSTQPFFKALAKENLRKLAKLPTGKNLFKCIAEARPGNRAKEKPKGVNVVIKPPLTRQFSAPGLKGGAGGSPITMGDQGKYDGWYYGKGGKLMPSISSKISAQEISKKDGQLNSGGWPSCGCTCYLFYSNFEIISNDGTWLPPHITMGHELIHCLHFMTGIGDPDYKREEHMTVGIKGFEDQPITENKLRKESGMPLRVKYFADD